MEFSPSAFGGLALAADAVAMIRALRAKMGQFTIKCDFAGAALDPATEA